MAEPTSCCVVRGGYCARVDTLCRRTTSRVGLGTTSRVGLGMLIIADCHLLRRG
jgi:hypothetical protein